MKISKLLLSLSLVGLLGSLSIKGVEASYHYSNARAEDLVVEGGKMEISNGFLDEEIYDHEFPANPDGDLNREALDKIYGKIEYENSLKNPDSIVNGDLALGHIVRMNYYITSEDVTLDKDGKKIKYRDYFNIKDPDLFFVIQRLTNVGEDILTGVQHYAIYTTNNNHPDSKKMVKPVYRTMLTWTADHMLSEKGTYKIDISQEGYAPQKSFKPRYVEDGSNISSRSFSLFDFEKWTKAGVDMQSAIDLDLVNNELKTVSVGNLKEAWYRIKLSTRQIAEIKANPGVIVTCYRYDKEEEELVELKKHGSHVYETNHKVVGGNRDNSVYVKISGGAFSDFTIIKSYNSKRG